MKKLGTTCRPYINTENTNHWTTRLVIELWAQRYKKWRFNGYRSIFCERKKLFLAEI